MKTILKAAAFLVLLVGCSKNQQQQPPGGRTKYTVLTPDLVAGSVVSQYPAVVRVTLSSITPGTIATTRFLTAGRAEVSTVVVLEGPNGLVLESATELPSGRNEFQIRAETSADSRIFASFFAPREDLWWGLPLVVGEEFCVLRATLCPSVDGSGAQQLSLRFSEDLKESRTVGLLEGFSLKFEGELATCSFPTELSTVLGSEIFLSCSKPSNEAGRAELKLQAPPFISAHDGALSQCNGAGRFAPIQFDYSPTMCKSYESPR